MRVKGLEFGHFCAIQNLEPIAFEHLLTAPAFKGNDLPVNAFFAAAIKITQIRAHERACRGDHARVGQKVDVKMGHASRRRRYLAPTVNHNPAKEPARMRVIPRIPQKCAKEENDILSKGVKLIAKWVA